LKSKHLMVLVLERAQMRVLVPARVALRVTSLVETKAICDGKATLPEISDRAASSVVVVSVLVVSVVAAVSSVGVSQALSTKVHANAVNRGIFSINCSNLP
jgi:hypothetical protein